MSDQYVRVPRELLERITKDPMGVSSKKGHWGSVRELAELLSAPAEDVSAVVEEPVYQTCDGINGWIDVDRVRYTACQLDPEEYLTRVLFVRPQRPVLLPERIIGQQHGDKIAEAEQRGWNACLDAVEELNK